MIMGTSHNHDRHDSVRILSDVSPGNVPRSPADGSPRPGSSISLSAGQEGPGRGPGTPASWSTPAPLRTYPSRRVQDQKTGRIRAYWDRLLVVWPSAWDRRPD